MTLQSILQHHTRNKTRFDRLIKEVVIHGEPLTTEVQASNTIEGCCLADLARLWTNEEQVIVNLIDQFNANAPSNCARMDASKFKGKRKHELPVKELTMTLDESTGVLEWTIVSHLKLDPSIPANETPFDRMKRKQGPATGSAGSVGDNDTTSTK